VCVDHGRGYVAVTQELLDGSDVVAGFEQMRGEAVAQLVVTLLINCTVGESATDITHSSIKTSRLYAQFVAKQSRA
jgi:hypothetical protein